MVERPSGQTNGQPASLVTWGPSSWTAKKISTDLTGFTRKCLLWLHNRQLSKEVRKGIFFYSLFYLRRAWLAVLDIRISFNEPCVQEVWCPYDLLNNLQIPKIKKPSQTHAKKKKKKINSSLNLFIHSVLIFRMEFPSFPLFYWWDL